MRRIVIAFMSTVSAVVLLFSYHTSTNSGTTVASGGAKGKGTGSTTGGTTSGNAGATTPSEAPSSSSAGSSSSASGTYTGDAVDTRWGPVQVEITVANGTITQSTAVVYPQGNGRDQEINAYALPLLSQEVTQAQSAQIDAISGATVTSDGYISSLQSAIDKAHL